MHTQALWRNIMTEHLKTTACVGKLPKCCLSSTKNISKHRAGTKKKKRPADDWLTWVRGHWYVWGVVFPRREVTGVLHGAVARGSDPRGGSVHQGAPLREEVRRSSEIPSFHSKRMSSNPKSGKGRPAKSDATHVIILSFRSMCCIQSIAGFSSQKRSPRSSFLSKKKRKENRNIVMIKTKCIAGEELPRNKKYKQYSLIPEEETNHLHRSTEFLQ